MEQPEYPSPTPALYYFFQQSAKGQWKQRFFLVMVPDPFLFLSFFSLVNLQLAVCYADPDFFFSSCFAAWLCGLISALPWPFREYNVTWQRSLCNILPQMALRRHNLLVTWGHAIASAFALFLRKGTDRWYQWPRTSTETDSLNCYEEKKKEDQRAMEIRVLICQTLTE